MNQSGSSIKSNGNTINQTPRFNNNTSENGDKRNCSFVNQKSNFNNLTKNRSQLSKQDQEHYKQNEFLDIQSSNQHSSKAQDEKQNNLLYFTLRGTGMLNKQGTQVNENKIQNNDLQSHKEEYESNSVQNLDQDAYSPYTENKIQKFEDFNVQNHRRLNSAMVGSQNTALKDILGSLKKELRSQSAAKHLRVEQSQNKLRNQNEDIYSPLQKNQQNSIYTESEFIDQSPLQHQPKNRNLKTKANLLPLPFHDKFNRQQKKHYSVLSKENIDQYKNQGFYENISLQHQSQSVDEISVQLNKQDSYNKFDYYQFDKNYHKKVGAGESKSMLDLSDNAYDFIYQSPQKNPNKSNLPKVLSINKLSKHNSDQQNNRSQLDYNNNKSMLYQQGNHAVQQKNNKISDFYKLNFSESCDGDNINPQNQSSQKIQSYEDSEKFPSGTLDSFQKTQKQKQIGKFIEGKIQKGRQIYSQLYNNSLQNK